MKTPKPTIELAEEIERAGWKRLHQAFKEVRMLFDAAKVCRALAKTGGK